MPKIKTNSRTTNTIVNFSSSIVGQLLTLVLQFVVRTVFIQTLGKSYLGIGGLFSNILSMLSLVELGVGSAILYKLYDPIEHKDEQRIAILMRFYKYAYRIIGIAVAIIGACLIPFLPFLIKDSDKLKSLGLNISVIFSLYLLKSVTSYLFFAFKSALIKANQKEYYVTIVGYITTVVGSVLQIVCLKLLSNFIVYISISIFQTILLNIICGFIADKMYPYINAKGIPRLPASEVKEIFKDCGALFLYKINSVVVKATDNLVLSILMGLDMVALYSNYYVFYTTINTLFSKIYNSVSHSLGSLHAAKSGDHEYEIFGFVMLIAAIMGGTSCVGILVCSNEFVEQWIGTEWVIDQPFSILMGLELFTLSIRAALAKYRSTMGLFQQSKFRPVAGMIINLVVSVVGVKLWGICGVLIGTLAADWFAFMWMDPLIVHKYGFNSRYPLRVYYFKLMRNLVVVLAVGFLDKFICENFVVGYGWLSIIIHALVCAVTVPAALFAVSYQSKEGKHLHSFVNNYFKRLKKRMKNG